METLHPLTHSSGKTQFLCHLHTKIVPLEFDLIESFYQDLVLKVFGKFTTLRSLCARKCRLLFRILVILVGNLVSCVCFVSHNTTTSKTQQNILQLFQQVSHLDAEGRSLGQVRFVVRLREERRLCLLLLLVIQ